MRPEHAEFRALFTGAETSFGQWDSERGARTEKRAPTDDDWQAHFDGQLGIGIVPVREDGTCRFAALDIDVDTIDHAELERRVTKLKLPGIVCRSKSGGAHLYFFFQEPGPQAQEVRARLETWSVKLGYGTLEVFPKQNKLSRAGTANWINLPYFGDGIDRYAVHKGRRLGLDGFVRLAQTRLLETVPEAEEEFPGAPPCLTVLADLGIPEGSRNNGLFNMGVYFRKSSPDNWQQRLRAFNSERVQPPVSERELTSIIRSLDGRTYQYKCAELPIVEHCQRAVCLRRAFGVGQTVIREGTFHEFMPGRLMKFELNPPRYRLEVNGTALDLSGEELQQFRLLRAAMFERLNLLVAPRKQIDWEAELAELLNRMELIEAPADADQPGYVMAKIKEFLRQSDKAKSKQAVLRGLPFRDGDEVIFRGTDLRTYLHNNRIRLEQNTVLWPMMRDEGCSNTVQRIGGKLVRLWVMPAPDLEPALDVQQEADEF